MRSNLKTALAVVLLIGVVFVATLVSQYSGSADAGPGAGGPEVGGPSAAVPLLFSTREMYFDPAGEELSRRHFPGFYEVSSDLVPAPFWFKNPHPEPVLVTVRGRSCTSCTSARVAAVPPAKVAALAKVAAADLALGPFAMPGLMTALVTADTVAGLEWKQLDFESPETGVSVPAAVSPAEPAWGVLQLDVKVTGVGPKTLEALVGTRLGARPTETQTFKVSVTGASGFAVDKAAFPLGEMPEAMDRRELTVTAFSATRGFDRFPPPAVAVNSQDGFVVAGLPAALSADDLLKLDAQLSVAKQGVRTKSGYRIPVTVHRRRPAGGTGPAEPEVGPFERQVGISGPGGAVTVTVSGTVTGVVALQDGGVIDLKDFNAKFGVARDNINLVSDRPDVTLAVDPAATTPAYLGATLSPPRDENGRRFWSLKLAVPAGAADGDLPKDAAVVLTATTKGEPVRVRVPVKGRAFRRGV